MPTKTGGERSLDFKTYLESQAEHWDRRSHRGSRKLRCILRMCDLHTGQRILNVSCGSGILFPGLLIHDPSLVMGIDTSESLTDKARQKYQDKRLRIVTADFYQLQAGSFDRIIINNNLNFNDQERFVKQISDLLVADGRFVVTNNKGRENVNAVYRERGAAKYDIPFKPNAMEYNWFDPYFILDGCVDTSDLYILTGQKRG